MDERSPLDDRSLTHTSREPEGQAWAQIGTKTPIPKTQAQPAPTTSNPPAVPEQSESPSQDEDTLSDADEGRPLQVVEDAELERSNAEPERSNEASSSTEEKKDGGEVNSGSSSLDSSREKSETRGRDRTNSSDPKMIRARVFVGHLNTDKCSRSELEELFSPFGKVASCSLQHGYGFVQYHDEQAAKRAITELHGLQFKGMKLGM